jgi:hypothetical protein
MNLTGNSNSCRKNSRKFKGQIEALMAKVIEWSNSKIALNEVNQRRLD